MNKDKNSREQQRFVGRPRPTLHPDKRLASQSSTMGKEMLQIDPVAEMVRVRKYLVLEKAIASLEAASSSSREKLAAIAHEMGGAIAFYTFEAEAKELSDFSHLLEKNIDMPLEEIESMRKHLVELLKQRLLDKGATEKNSTEKSSTDKQATNNRDESEK